MRYAPNRCVAFAAFPVFLTVWIREGIGTPPLTTYINSILSLAKKLFMELLAVESYLSSHPPPQVRKRLGVSGVRDAFFSPE